MHSAIGLAKPKSRSACSPATTCPSSCETLYFFQLQFQPLAATAPPPPSGWRPRGISVHPTAVVPAAPSVDRHAVRHRIGSRATQPASKLESGDRAIVHAACVHPCGNAAARASESQHAPPRRRSRLGAAASPRANARGQLAGRASGWPGPAAVGASRVRAQVRMAGWRRSPSTRRASSRTRRRPRGVAPHGQTRPLGRPRAQGGLPSRKASAHARALALGASAHAPSVGHRGERTPDPKASA